MKRFKKIAFSVPSDTFQGSRKDSVNRTEEAEEINEFSTIDGNIISQVALKTALETGKGLMVGGFFVGTTLSADMLCIYPNAL